MFVPTNECCAAARAVRQATLANHPSRCPSVRLRLGALLVLVVCVSSSQALAQERPYFLTYDHYLEEVGNLELEYASTVGTQRGGHGFHAFWTEFGYGATGWWTTELYLDGQTTFSDGTLFTGFRWENRFRPLAHEHFLNPIVYVEYEQLNGADKILKEVEGHDVESDYGDPNALLRQARKHELELKLLLSKSLGGWNFALNPLAGKNLSSGDPWEFGYAVGVSRPLALEASPTRCTFCRENFIVGLELYGGLGDTQLAGLPATSHYLAPVAAWTLPSGWAVRGSVGFGLNQNSHRLLVRWSVSREVSDFGGIVSHLFGSRGEDQRANTNGVHHRHEGHDHYAELAQVPGNASAERNPLHQDSSTVAAGAKLFDQHCAECHGATGHGSRRGPSLKEERLRQATPGALYWVLSNGVVRHGMPDWSKLPERERWQIVTFLTSHHD